MNEKFPQEFLRVTFDKMLLFGLLIFLFQHHAPDFYTGGAFGALMILVQGQRFRIPGPSTPQKPIEVPEAAKPFDHLLTDGDRIQANKN